MAGDVTTNPDQQQQDPPAEEKTGDTTGGQPAQNGGESGKTFSQADVDRIVAERLAREKQAAEKATQKAKEAAEEQALAEQQKWQELAGKHGKRAEALEADLQARSTEAETLKAKAERYEQALSAQLMALREGLPAHIITLLDRLDPVDQLEYIATNREALVGKQQAGGGGVPASPKPKGESGEISEDERRKQSVSARTYF